MMLYVFQHNFIHMNKKVHNNYHSVLKPNKCITVRLENVTLHENSLVASTNNTFVSLHYPRKHS